MKSHLRVAGVQESGCGALCNIVARQPKNKVEKHWGGSAREASRECSMRGRLESGPVSGERVCRNPVRKFAVTTRIWARRSRGGLRERPDSFRIGDFAKEAEASPVAPVVLQIRERR